jgi:hypothetical protein
LLVASKVEGEIMIRLHSSLLYKALLVTASTLTQLATIHPADAETLMYMDEAGNIHHVTNASAIPKRYQGQLIPSQDSDLDREMQEKIYQEYQQRRLQEIRANIRGDDVREAQRERERREKQEERERAKALRNIEREQRRAEKQQEKEMRRRQKLMLQAGVDPRVVFTQPLGAETVVPNSAPIEDAPVEPVEPVEMAPVP